MFQYLPVDTMKMVALFAGFQSSRKVVCHGRPNPFKALALFLLTCISASQIAASKMQFSATRTHYEILGIPKDADAEVIKKAYRTMALKQHPDKFPADKYSADEREAASRRFEEVNEAFSVLSDPNKRRLYDKSLELEPAPGHRQVLECTISCTLAELGGWKEVPLHAAILATQIPSGIVSRALRGAMASLRLSVFGGVPRQIRLPAGSASGDSLRVPVATGLELLLHINEIGDRRFERSGDHLHTSIWLPWWHKFHKPPIRMRAPCGSWVVLSPRGAKVRHGEVCRVRGFGMPSSSASDVRGDLIVRCRIRSLQASLWRASLRIGGTGTSIAVVTRPKFLKAVLCGSYCILRKTCALVTTAAEVYLYYAERASG